LSVNAGSSLRSANDLFNVFISSLGNYLYYNTSSTFGHINTSYSVLSWFINSSGNATIPTVNTTNSSITNATITNATITNATITNATITTQNIQPIFITALSYSVSDVTPTMVYISGSSNMTIGFNPLSSTNNYNIYEFRNWYKRLHYN